LTTEDAYVTRTPDRRAKPVQEVSGIPGVSWFGVRLAFRRTGLKGAI